MGVNRLSEYMGQSDSGSSCEITIIIPCYKRADLVSQAVRSTLALDFDPIRYEVLVVDSSPDSEVERAVDDLRPLAQCHLQYLHKKPEGPGPSRNFGAQHARGRVFAFLDSDCVASPGWLTFALPCFEDPRVGIVQGRTLPVPGKPQGIFTHTIRVERESFLYETANIFYRRECFFAAGGFKMDWNPHAISPLGGEDTELAWHAKRLGWTSCFARECLVHHEIRPMAFSGWFWIGRQRVFPELVSRLPELRQHFFLRYFFDKAQALLVLGLFGTALSPFFPILLATWAPYVIHRASEPSRTLQGPFRLLRPVFYLSRDCCSLLILTWGSVRARKLLL